MLFDILYHPIVASLLLQQSSIGCVLDGEVGDKRIGDGFREKTLTLTFTDHLGVVEEGLILIESADVVFQEIDLIDPVFELDLQHSDSLCRLLRSCPSERKVKTRPPPQLTSTVQTLPIFLTSSVSAKYRLIRRFRAIKLIPQRVDLLLQFLFPPL